MSLHLIIGFFLENYHVSEKEKYFIVKSNKWINELVICKESKSNAGLVK